jgi:Cdc6-like AAA superfamily ATPase
MLAAVVKSLNATGTRVILCLDEVEALISKEGAQPLYWVRLTLNGKTVDEAEVKVSFSR